MADLLVVFVGDEEVAAADGRGGGPVEGGRGRLAAVAVVAEDAHAGNGCYWSAGERKPANALVAVIDDVEMAVGVGQDIRRAVQFDLGGGAIVVQAAAGNGGDITARNRDFADAVVAVIGDVHVPPLSTETPVG